MRIHAWPEAVCDMDYLPVNINRLLSSGTEIADVFSSVQEGILKKTRMSEWMIIVRRRRGICVGNTVTFMERL